MIGLSLTRIILIQTYLIESNYGWINFSKIILLHKITLIISLNILSIITNFLLVLILIFAIVILIDCLSPLFHISLIFIWPYISWLVVININIMLFIRIPARFLILLS